MTLKKTGGRKILKNQIDESIDLDETAAADSIQTKPSAASGPKTEMMSTMINAMSGMGKDDLSHFLTQALALIGQEGSVIPDGTAENNAASIAMKGDARSALLQGVKEDVAELFGSEELSEEFKEKATTLFEAAVHARVVQIEEEIIEEYEAALEEEVGAVTEALTEKVDQYLSYVAEEWVKENEVAIESTLRSEMTESFMEGLRNLFQEHNLYIPEEEVDVVEALTAKVEELEDDLNESTNANIELVDILEEYSKNEIFSEIAEGLALTQVDKFKTLAESVEFDMDDEDKYRSKLEVIKQSHFGIKAKPSTLNEEVELEDEELNEEVRTIHSDPMIDRYAQAISRTTKR